jgi:hypothetical protein
VLVEVEIIVELVFEPAVYAGVSDRGTSPGRRALRLVYFLRKRGIKE